MERTFIPYVSIKPNYLSFYEVPEFRLRRSEKQVDNEKNLLETHHKGKISKKARQRIENAISWLLTVAERKKFFSKKHNKHFYFKVNFCTLTLASQQVHSDNEIKKTLLNQFLTEVRQKHKVRHYLWKAESQRNGNIHFHVLMDKYIHYSDIRSMWNRIQDKLGYIERYADKTGDFEPPSTEIKSIKHVKNLPRYLAKYCTKESEHRSIQGKQWGLSYSLSHLKAAITVPTNQMMSELKEIANKYYKRVVKYDYSKCIYVPVHRWKKLLSGELYQLFQKYYNDVINPPPEFCPLPLRC